MERAIKICKLGKDSRLWLASLLKKTSAQVFSCDRSSVPQVFIKTKENSQENTYVGVFL